MMFFLFLAVGLVAALNMSAGELQVRTTAAGVRLRQQPSTSAAIVRELPQGTVLTVLENADGAKAKIGQYGQWLNVRDSGNTGYVAAWYVELVGSVNPPPPPPPSGSCGFVKFSQCDSAWKNILLGFNNDLTICDAGCAITSVAMALPHWGKNMNPAQLNNFLKENGGYQNGGYLVWGAVNGLGPQWKGTFSTGPSTSTVRNALASCNAFIAMAPNQYSNWHYVLVTGYQGGDSFSVNDPANLVTSRTVSQMKGYVIYG
jgi:hypothetical protein